MEKQKVNFSLCKWEEIHEIVEKYLKDNNIVIESFWEEHVLASNHYKMTCNGEIIGYFAIHKSSTIVLFNVFTQYANQSQELFNKIKKYEQVTNAMVTTGDEFFLSHCIDSFVRIEKQAYFSIYTDKEMSKDRQIALSLKIANIDKDSEILKLSGDFLDEPMLERMKKRDEYLNVYIAEHYNKTIGFGIVEYGKIVQDIASIGMFVCEEYRCQGYGGNILQNLKHIVHEKGYRAFSGCWYYNHNSKKSMESAGAYSKTRLIRLFF